MNYLIKMIKNTSENTYHPIFYKEHPFLVEDANSKVVRYKSVGHRTDGFVDRQAAIDSIQTEVIDRLPQGTTFLKELDEVDDMPWDGVGVPADVQLRHS